jgi:hypothetical protein
VSFKSSAQRKAAMAKRRAPSKIKAKRLTATEFEFTSHGYDWHLRRERGQWVLDQFDSSIRDADDAHVRTIECESKKDALQHIREEPPKGGDSRAV